MFKLNQTVHNFAAIPTEKHTVYSLFDMNRLIHTNIDGSRLLRPKATQYTKPGIKWNYHSTVWSLEHSLNYHILGTKAFLTKLLNVTPGVVQHKYEQEKAVCFLIRERNLIVRWTRYYLPELLSRLREFNRKWR